MTWLASFLVGLWRCDAQDARKDYKFTVFCENDAFAGHDRHYTQGAGIEYLSPDLEGPTWLLKAGSGLPAVGIEPEASKFSVSFRQEIYTPEDLRAVQVVRDDRPYAGWLYSTFAYYRRGPGWFDRPARDVWGLDFGIVGPESQAEDAQKTWHVDDPHGWNNQLKTELAFDFWYEKSSQWRWGSDEGWSASFIPFWGGAAGTVTVHGKLGARFQFGYNAPDLYAVETPPMRYGLFVFGGWEGRYVLHNIFLDGNTFVSSHHIEKEPWVGEVHLGVSLVLKRLQISARQTVRSEEFKGQHEHDTFSAAYISYTF